MSPIALKQICSPLGFDHYATLFPQACATRYALISEAVGRQTFRIKPDQGMYVRVRHGLFCLGTDELFTALLARHRSESRHNTRPTASIRGLLRRCAKR